jgi:hypothetical protein
MKPVKIPGFTGINNRTPADRLPKDEAGRSAVRDAVNVDLSTASTFQTRPGFTLAISEAQCRSMFSVDAMASLMAVGSELRKFTGSASTKVADIASPFVSVAYTKTPFGPVWSDGFRMRLVRNWIDEPLLPPDPNPSPSVSASSGGSLLAGAYGVAFAAVMPDGRKSAMTVPVYVDVPASGRIQISTSAQAYPLAIYVTATNGELFYREAIIQSGSASIGILNQAGEPASFDVLQMLPAGRVLGYHDGRLLSAVGPYLYHGQPYSLGLHKPDSDFILFPDDIRIIASLDTGILIVATESAHWRITGPLSQASMTQIAPYGASLGTMVDLPNSKGLMWFTPRGPLSASQDGSISLLQDAEIQFPRADVGASVFRETNGMRQYITTLSQPVPSGAAVARSFMDARVIE